MKVLLTGAFGNIGHSTLIELIGRGYSVRCFDIPSRKNKRISRKHNAGVVWGDLRDAEAVKKAVEGTDVVVHLGTLSAVLWYFRHDVMQLSTDWTRSCIARKTVGESRLAWIVIFATIPVGAAGLLFHDFIE